MIRWLDVLLREERVFETLDSALAGECSFEIMAASCFCTYCSQAGAMISFVVVILRANVVVMGLRH
jgi:hypothetical protein